MDFLDIVMLIALAVQFVASVVVIYNCCKIVWTLRKF